MKKRYFIAVLVSSAVLIGSTSARASDLAADAKLAVDAAEVHVEQARVSIERGKELIALIPEDSPLMSEVAQVIKLASDNWVVATEALEGAKKSATKITTTANQSVVADYLTLARVDAAVAVSGANVVQIGMRYVEAVANNKTESLDIIRSAMDDTLSDVAQIQFNYEKVKRLIKEKYSK